ncbi:MAG: hypothetical protein U0903_09535 [Planctomycetales bacterium]
MSVSPPDAPGCEESPLASLEQASLPPVPWRKPIRFLFWSVQMGFGFASLIIILAALAAIPVVNFAVLGYFLQAETDIVRKGRWSAVFPWGYLMPRLGSLSLGLTLFFVPLTWLASAAYDAQLVEPGGRSAQFLVTLTRIMTVVIVIHLSLAIARGGNLGSFFRPIRNLRWFLKNFRHSSFWRQADQTFWKFGGELKLAHCWWIGLRAFTGSFLWLFLPTLMLASTRKTQGLPVVLTVIGGLWLIPVLAVAPFLQIRATLLGRWRENFSWRAIRRERRRAPLAWLLAVIITYALSLPVYLTTVVIPPRDGFWLLTPTFILTIYPARMLVAWGYRQSTLRATDARWYWRWPCYWLGWGALGAYVFLLFFTQFIGAHGKLVLFQHHAILLPSPL